MILKEQNNQKKTLTDGVLDMNHEQENTPSTNGKASPWAFSLSFPDVLCVLPRVAGADSQHRSWDLILSGKCSVP